MSLKHTKDHPISPTSRSRIQTVCTLFSLQILFEGMETTLRGWSNADHEMFLGMWSSQILSFGVIVHFNFKKSSGIMIVTFKDGILPVKFISKVKLTGPVHLLRRGHGTARPC